MAQGIEEIDLGSNERQPPHEVLLVSAGASHSVALLSGNVICSWGRGEDGQLGHGDAEDRLVPTIVTALDSPKIVSLTCGADHTIAYSEIESQVFSWGWGDFGRLGHGNSSDLFTPHPIKVLQGLKIKQIACGDSHCLAVTIDGQVRSWGRNQNGQLGLGTTEDSLVPQVVQAFEGISVKMVAAGAEHTAAITEDGELYGWGWGRYGNLGLGDREDRLVPVKVSSVEGEKMVLVACGWRHTICVSYTGCLYTYGWSKYGQLGQGDFEDHLTPHKLEALSDHCVSQISGGWRHTMALTSNGILYGWGWNKFGQVGVGDNSDHCSPVQVKFPNNQVTSVRLHQGESFCMMESSINPNNLLPVPVVTNYGFFKRMQEDGSWALPQIHKMWIVIRADDLTILVENERITQVACGWRHTIALTETKNVFSWGRGTSGQLGHGEIVDRYIPKIIEALSSDGSQCEKLESSTATPTSGKIWVSPSERYALVPNENVARLVGRNDTDVNVPENDAKRIRI